MKIFAVALGCAKNRVDLEVIINYFEESGHELVFEEKNADAVLIMTCAFIEQAREEAENTILEFSAKKKRYGFHLLVGGCYAKRFAEAAPERFPEVDLWFGVSGFEKTAQMLDSLNGAAGSNFIQPADTVYPIYAGRKLTTPPHWAWLKIAEGCNHRCAFCAIPGIRGVYRSRKMEDIVAEAEALAAGGVKELQIIAQDTGLYGKDIYGEPKLVNLLAKLQEIEGISWIRLLYINPYSVSDELIDFMASSERVLKYLDIPFQHASDSLLKAMHRPGSFDGYLGLLASMRAKIPQLAVRSSFIVGFPGETDKDFNILKEFITEARINRAGFFVYSNEEGTPSYSYPGQIDERVKQGRMDELTRMQKKISFENSMKLKDTVTDVMVDSVKPAGQSKRLLEIFGRGALRGITHVGRMKSDAPEVDGLVFIRQQEGSNIGPGDIIKLKITEVSPFDLAGNFVGKVEF